MNTTSTLTKKSNREIRNLRKEVRILRSLVVSILAKDKEGKYRPNFVKNILSAAEETPTHRFGSAKAFLQDLK
jgi:hypothetical protein